MSEDRAARRQRLLEQYEALHGLDHDGRMWALYERARAGVEYDALVERALYHVARGRASPPPVSGSDS